MAGEMIKVQIEEDDPLQIFVDHEGPEWGTTVEIPLELYERYKKARAEMSAVQDELNKIRSDQ